MSKIKELSGQRFGRLLVLESTKERIRRDVVWLCRCDCGNLKKENHMDFKEMLEHQADKFRKKK